MSLLTSPGVTVTESIQEKCSIHLRTYCPCLDSEISQSHRGQPFEAGRWECDNGHVEFGAPRLVSAASNDCARCGGQLTRTALAVIHP